MQRTPPWPPEQAQQPNLLANLLQSLQQQQQPHQNLFAGLVGLANAWENNLTDIGIRSSRLLICSKLILH